MRKDKNAEKGVIFLGLQTKGFNYGENIVSFIESFKHYLSKFT